MLNRKSSNYSPQSFSSSSLLAFLMVLSQWEPCMSIMSRWSPSALMECSCMACCSSSALSRNPSWHSGQIISDPLSDSSFLESSFLSSLLESAKRWHENHEIMHFLRDYFYPMHPLVTRCRLTLLWNAFICDRLQWLAVVLPAGGGWCGQWSVELLCCGSQFSLRLYPLSRARPATAGLASSHTSCQSKSNCISRVHTALGTLILSLHHHQHQESSKNTAEKYRFPPARKTQLNCVWKYFLCLKIFFYVNV